MIAKMFHSVSLALVSAAAAVLALVAGGLGIP